MKLIKSSPPLGRVFNICVSEDELAIISQALNEASNGPRCDSVAYDVWDRLDDLCRDENVSYLDLDLNQRREVPRG